MDHIFSDEKFQLKDLGQLCDWLKDPEAEQAFFNGHLVAGTKGKDTPLSHSTIMSMAHSMLELLKYVNNFLSDKDVQEAHNSCHYLCSWH